MATVEDVRREIARRELERREAERAKEALPGNAFTQTAIQPFLGLNEGLGVSGLTRVAGGVDVDPENRTGELLRSGGRAVGASVPFMAAPFVAGAAQGAGLIGRGTGAIGGALQNVINTAQRAPVLTGAAETASAFGAGVGGEAARGIAPGNEAAELTGEIIGGLSPAVAANTPIGIAGRAATRVARDHLSSEARRRNAENAVGDVLRGLSDESQTNLQATEALRRDIPGFNPSLAQASNDPALVATQREIESRASGAELNRMVEHRRANERALAELDRRSAPGSGSSPNSLLTNIQESRRAAAERLPALDRAETGRSIRQRLIDERRAVSARMSARADELGLNNTDVSVPFSERANALIEEFSTQRLFDDKAAEPKVLGVLREVVQRNAPVTFDDLRSLRERVSNDLIDEVSSANPKRARIRVLTQMKQSVDEVISDLTQSADPELAQRYATFRNEYFSEFINRFERGAARQVLSNDNRGFRRTNDERVADVFFRPGDTTAIRQYVDIFGGSPDGLSDIRASALDSLRQAAVKDGVIQPAKYEAWLRRHASVLREVPGLTDELANIQRADAALMGRQGVLDQRSADIEGRAFANALARFDQTGDGAATLRQALDSPQMMGRLVASLRDDQDALNGLRRFVWAEAPRDSARAFQAFLSEHRGALNLALGPKHLSNLARIASGHEILERVPVPEGAAVQPRVFGSVEERMGTGFNQLASRVFAVKSGRTSYRYITADLAGRAGRAFAQRDFARMFEAALYDADLASDLAATVRTGGRSQAVRGRLNGWLFALGLHGGEEPAQP